MGLPRFLLLMCTLRSLPLRHCRLPLTLLAMTILLLPGCAVVQVKERQPSAGDLRREARKLQLESPGPAGALLVAARQRGVAERDSTDRLIEVVRLTQGARPGSPGAAMNRAATAELVDRMAGGGFAPLPLGSGGTLNAAPASRAVLDPRTADRFLRADTVEIKGLRVRTTQPGVGVPCVAWFRPDSPVLRGQPGVPRLAGMSQPVTAVLVWRKGQPEMVFQRTQISDRLRVDGREKQLAADFSAPLAVMVAQGRNRNLDLRSLLRSDRNINNAGLGQFEIYDPQKVPVVFVHGLMSRPETWVPAVNELLGDREIRERYQFWFFLYPTGLPVWWSAAKLRMELDRYRRTLDPERNDRNLDRMVLAGHSMGGLISSLLVREGGRKLWYQFSDKDPYALNISPASRAKIEEMIKFSPRNDVDRVVYFATPHRGSQLAVNPVASFFANLIRLPFTPVEKERYLIAQAVRDEFRGLFLAPINSIRFLQAKSPLLLAILNLPARPDVPYHSIIGDRGRGDTPNSSDGVVPYWSSHLQNARSEKIVPSGHGTNENPEGIAEFGRILREHLGIKPAAKQDPQPAVRGGS